MIESLLDPREGARVLVQGKGEGAGLSSGMSVPVLNLSSEGEMGAGLETKVVLTQEDFILLGVATAGMTIIVVAGGKLVAAAMLVSLLSVGGLVTLYLKIPRRCADAPLAKKLLSKFPMGERRRVAVLEFDWKAWLLEHELVADVLITTICLSAFGFTLTGMMAAGISDLAFGIILRGRKILRACMA